MDEQQLAQIALALATINGVVVAVFISLASLGYESVAGHAALVRGQAERSAGGILEALEQLSPLAIAIAGATEVETALGRLAPLAAGRITDEMSYRPSRFDLGVMIRSRGHWLKSTSCRGELD